MERPTWRIEDNILSVQPTLRARIMRLDGEEALSLRLRAEALKLYGVGTF